MQLSKPTKHLASEAEHNVPKRELLRMNLFRVNLMVSILVSIPMILAFVGPSSIICSERRRFHLMR
jgi:hypothetical protein